MGLRHHLRSISGKTWSLSYDANGNLVGKTNVADAGDATRYTWDTRNRLIALDAPGLVARFEYDPLGRRIARTVNGQTTAYLYDGAQAIGEIRGAQTTAVLTGVAMDEALARYAGSGRLEQLTDHLGSVIRRIGEDGSTRSRTAYSPYGESSTEGDAQGDGTGYTGREDDGTGLYFYRARYYDPVLGRFVSEDPIGVAGGINIYLYAEANPLMYADPLGLWAWGDPLPQGVVDFSAGMGDTLSLGLTDWVRDQMGTNGAVNKCSGAYDAGEWAGAGVAAATGVAGGIRAAGSRGAGREFSHWIPNRMGGPRSIWNGNYVTPARHYYHDPFRYPRGWRDLGPKWPAWAQQLDRIPNAYKGSAAGAGWGAAGMGKNGDCTCQR